MVSALLVEYFVIGEGLALQLTVNHAVFVDTHISVVFLKLQHWMELRVQHHTLSFNPPPLFPSSTPWIGSWVGFTVRVGGQDDKERNLAVGKS
jgi:hypothetical protein